MKNLILKYTLCLFLGWNSFEVFSQASCTKADAGPDRILCKPCLEGKGGNDCEEKVEIGSLEPDYDCCGAYWKPEDNVEDPYKSKTKANPENTTTYKLTVSNEDFTFKGSDEMEVIVTDIKIEFNGDEINGETPETWIGGQIELEAKVEPDHLNVTAYKWEIEGLSQEFAIKNFVKSEASPTIEKLNPSDLESESITFYWWKGKENYKISCEVTIELEGEEYSCKREAEIKVKTPIYTMTATTTGPIGQSVVDGKRYLSFGLINGQDPPGISFHSTVKQDGTIFEKKEYWQKIYLRRSYHHTANQAWANLNYDLNDNHVGFPYKINGGPGKTQDSPSGQLKSPYDSLIACDRFHMWLMFKPAGSEVENSIFVPLAKIDWNWGGKAAFDVNTQAWIDYDHVYPPANLVGLPITKLDEFPNWSNTWTNVFNNNQTYPIPGPKEICNQ